MFSADTPLRPTLSQLAPPPSGQSAPLFVHVPAERITNMPKDYKNM